jgi:YHS domain-containing protein
MVRDPVCGVALEVGKAVRVDYHGNAYYFCSHDCRINFEDRPDEYAHVYPKQRLDETIMAPLKPLLASLGRNDVKN